VYIYSGILRPQKVKQEVLILRGEPILPCGYYAETHNPVQLFPAHDAKAMLTVSMLGLMPRLVCVYVCGVVSCQEWQHKGAYCFLEAFGCPESLSRFDSIAGGTKGRMTADVINVPATADCNLVAGLGACAEK